MASTKGHLAPGLWPNQKVNYIANLLFIYLYIVYYLNN